MSLFSYSMRCTKYFLYALLSIFLLTLSLILLGLFTHKGNVLVFNSIQALEPRLTIEISDGTILNKPTFKTIRWSDGEMLFSFNQLSYEFDWGCLISEVCLQSLTLDSAQINIALDETTPLPESEENSDPFVLNFPLPIHIKNLDISNTNVQVAGVEIDVKNVVLSADGVKNDLSLISTVTGLTVTLPDTQEKQNHSASTVKTSHKLTSLPAILNNDTLPEVILPFNLLANQLDVNGFKLVLNKQNLIMVNQAKSQFTYRGSKIEVSKSTFDLPQANLNLQGNIALTARYPMDINATINVKNIEQLQPNDLFKGQKIQLHSKGDLANLSSELTLSKLINAQIKNKIDLYSKNLPYQLNMNWKQLNWPLTGDATLQTSQGKVTSSGNLNNYQLNVEGQYQIEKLPAGNLNLKSQGNLQQLTISQLLINTLQGNLLLTGALKWDKAITWLGDLNIANVNFSEWNENYPATLNGQIKQSVTIQFNDNNQPAWAFDLPLIELQGSFLDRALHINGKINGDANNGFNVQHVNIENANNRATINGSIAKINNLEIELDVQNLEKIILQAEGKVKGKVTFAGSIDNIEVNSQLQGSNLRYLESSIKTLKVNAKAILAALPVIDLTLSADNIISYQQAIESISIAINPVKVSKKEVKHKIDLNLNSEILSTRLELFMDQQTDKWQASLQKGRLYSKQGIWILNKPINISVDQGDLLLTEHCWLATDKQQKDNGKICINQFKAGKEGDINIHVDDFLISTFDPFIPNVLALEGAIDSSIKITWQENKKPLLNFKLDGKNIGLNIQANQGKNKIIHYPVKKLQVKMTSTQEQADFSVIASSEGFIQAHINGYLKPYLPTPEINAKLDLLVPDFNVFSTLIPKIDKLAGHLQSNMNIHGSIKKPNIKGRVLIGNGDLLAVGFPVQITDLNAVIDINENNANVTGHFFTNTQQATEKKEKTFVDELVSLKDSAVSAVNIPQRIISKIADQKTNKTTDGRADISGFLNWQDNFKGNIHFKADQMHINDYGKIDLYVSPNIDLTFAEHLTLKGNINVDKGKITIKELPEGAVSVSKDVIVIDAKKKHDSTDIPVIMDIALSLGEQLHVKALGLDTFINGNLIIRKALLKKLRMNGEVTFENGTYTALAQQLILRKSRIIFQGPIDSPYLNIEAIRDPNKTEDNVTAGVRVTGTPDQLQLSIFSDPAMSQQNALSYITRGRSIENSSGDANNSQLAALLIDIGAGQTEGLMNDIGNKVGISDLELASTGQGEDQSVGIKGTIAPGVELSYGVGVFDSFTIFAIRYELFKKFYIEASSGLYQAIDAYYEWDWD